jgi:hypothetical protein
LIARLESSSLSGGFSASTSNEARAHAFEELGFLTIVEPHSYEFSKFGGWVISGLTPRRTEIAKAIIRVSSRMAFEGGARSINEYNFQPKGAPTHEIVVELESLTGKLSLEHGVNEACKRSPEVFVATSPGAWGLVATFGEPFDPKAKKAPAGVISKTLEQVMVEADRPLYLNEILRRVRSIYSDATEMTVRLYLRSIQTDKYESLAEDTYSVRESFLEARNHPQEFGQTIATLMQVMNDADRPLTLNEIVDRCSDIGQFSHMAIRGYISGNYRDKFEDLPDGTYRIR